MSSTDLSREAAAQIARSPLGPSGEHTAPGTTPDTAATRRGRWIATRHAHVRTIGPGLALAVFVALVAIPLGTAEPVIGAPVLAIVLGIVLAAAIRPAEHLRPGLNFAARPVLQSGIMVIGATLSLHQVARVGLESLPVMLGTLTVAFIGAWGLGRLLGIPGELQILIGVGTGICGASAIAATSAVLAPKRSNVAYAIGTIFTFNIIAVLLFPALGHAWKLGPHPFGLWAGTAINDTSSVAAAAFAYSPDAGPYAVVVKLCRTLALIPITVILGMLRARRDRAEPDGPPAGLSRAGRARRRFAAIPWRRLMPLFLLGFLLASTLATLGLIPASWNSRIVEISTFLITTALAAIGLSMRLSDIRGAGPRPLLMGGLLWILLAATSLGLQTTSHSL